MKSIRNLKLALNGGQQATTTRNLLRSPATQHQPVRYLKSSAASNDRVSIVRRISVSSAGQQSTTQASYAATRAQTKLVAVEPSQQLEELDEDTELEPAAEDTLHQFDANRQIEAHQFVNRHIGPKESELNEMLAYLGYSTLEQLIDETIPDEIRLDRRLRLPKALSEHELLEQLNELGQLNQSTEWRNFIGLGYYDCVTPPAILRNIFENPSWTTAYTAYQAEIAQGRLESLMNFQTMVSDLTGLDVANASLLDEATAAAEALQVCLRVDKLKRQKFLLSKHCHPQTRAVVETRAQALGVQVDYFDELLDDLRADTPLSASLKDYCGVLVQYPNCQGRLYDLDRVTAPCHEAQSLVVVATDLMACTLFKPPGDFEHPADLAVGSAQRFGVPLNFGGPHAAFLACQQKLIRSIPGRVVGLTRDSNGQPAYRFALQTREQHIRRDKATSNICTAQALLANMSAMYAVYHGPAGLKDIASSIHLKTSLLAHLIRAEPALELTNEGSYFDTLTLRVDNLDSMDQVKRRAQEAKFNLRYFSEQRDQGQENFVSVALDETTKLSDIFKLAHIFNLASAEQPAHADHYNLTVPLDNQLSALKRRTDFLSHPTFNSHHSEAQLVRYMKQLESKDISLANSMIPLGSCTMKLNATSQMVASSWAEFARLHPFQPAEQCAGYARLLRELEQYLCEITGYERISFQPNSGAQGEYAGLRCIKAYLESRGEWARNVCLIPISAHGTNPASAQMAGFQIKTVKVRDDGNIDMQDLEAKVAQHAQQLACLMITYPSTFGVFEENVRQVCELVHAHGGQVYLDGANMNAQVGLCRPGDYGSDVSHLNLHKTFCIPHGGGGPGAGPIGVKAHLAPFLPTHPLAGGELLADGASAGELSASFGTVSAARFGSPAILPISWSYIRLMGAQLARSSQVAILNANYMRKRLEGAYKILYRGARGNVAHEFILDCRDFKRTANVEATDIAKRLQDFGLHAPTVSWPVGNTLMLEPTESEDKRQLDNYCEALLAIRREIADIEAGRWARDENPLKLAPHTQRAVCSSEWARGYSREQAAYPASFVTPTNKIWPTVGRVDDTFGDTNLFCTCPPPPPADSA